MISSNIKYTGEDCMLHRIAKCRLLTNMICKPKLRRGLNSTNSPNVTSPFKSTPTRLRVTHIAKARHWHGQQNVNMTAVSALRESKRKKDKECWYTRKCRYAYQSATQLEGTGIRKKKVEREKIWRARKRKSARARRHREVWYLSIRSLRVQVSCSKHSS